MSLVDQLQAAVGAAHVDTVDERSWRVAPGSAAEVAEVIRYAAEARAAVYAIGAGSRSPTRGRTNNHGAGGPPKAIDAATATLRATPPLGVPALDRSRVMIATRRLDQVLQLDESSLLVHAQAGITGLELERILAPRGLSIGDYPPVVLTSSLGGIIAVRTPGKSSARHGFFEDAVVGVSAVLADGRSIHTRVAPRRATGPDLSRALMGSEGTIGFITSAVLRIHYKPEARLVAAYTLPSIDAAISAVYLALREEALPSGIRIYDAAEAAVHFGDELATPLPAGHVLMCVATAGPTDLATCDRDLITSAVIAEGGATADPELADLWWRRVHADVPTPGPVPSLQVMATPGKIRAVYRAVMKYCASIDIRARAHISRFDADGAVAFLTVETADGGTPEPAVLSAVEQAAERAGAWLLGARAHKLDAYLAALRDTLDPHRIMNPGALP